MAAYALTDLLPDFGAAPPARVVRAAPGTDVAPPPRMTPDEEWTQRMEAAVREAEAAVEARLAEAHGRALAELEARHEAETARLNAELGARAGQLVAERLERLESDVVSMTSAVAARLLGAVLSEEVRRHAIAELAGAIRAAIADREAVRIKVTGPLLLYDALKPALGRFAERVEFSEADGIDLVVALDSSLFETRIGEWSAALAEVLA